MLAKSPISTISSLLNLFLAFRNIFKQNAFTYIVKIKPTTAPIRPAEDIAFGVDINAIPTYIFVKLAAVKYHGDVLIFRDSSVKCLSDNIESVNEAQLSLGVFSIYN